MTAPATRKCWACSATPPSATCASSKASAERSADELEEIRQRLGHRRDFRGGASPAARPGAKALSRHLQGAGRNEYHAFGRRYHARRAAHGSASQGGGVCRGGRADPRAVSQEGQPGRTLQGRRQQEAPAPDRKSTRLNSSHGYISYAVFCLKKKKKSNIAEYAIR